MRSPTCMLKKYKSMNLYLEKKFCMNAVNRMPKNNKNKSVLITAKLPQPYI